MKYITIYHKQNLVFSAHYTESEYQKAKTRIGKDFKGCEIIIE